MGIPTVEIKDGKKVGVWKLMNEKWCVLVVNCEVVSGELIIARRRNGFEMVFSVKEVYKTETGINVCEVFTID